MFSSPTYALVLKGNEKSHAHEADKYLKFLTQEVGIPSHRVIFNHDATSPPETQRQIEKFFGSLPFLRQSNAVVIYVGHGNHGIFSPNGYPTDYNWLARMFDFRGQFIFINDSCKSGSCIDAFEEQGLPSDRGLIISSCLANEDAHPYVFINTILGSLRRGHIYDAGPINTAIEELDFSSPRVSKDVSGLTRERMEWAPLQSKTSAKTIQHSVRVGNDLEHILFSNP